MTAGDLTSQGTMIDLPEPGRFYHAEEFLRRFPRPLAYGSVLQFFLPTQIVVKAPQFVVPQVGRVYETEWYVVDDKVVGYQALNEMEEFKGTWYVPQMWVVEIWENYGSDGHTEMKFMGYVPIAKRGEEFDLDKLVTEAQLLARGQMNQI